MSAPLVSLYILNYNYAEYLPQCIDSVLRQDYENIQLFIIDDGSTDSSKQILEEYRQKYGIQVFFQSNAGLLPSIRTAFSFANGKYVIRVDADDWVTPNFVSELVLKAEETGSALVFPDYYEVDPDGKKLHEVKRFDFDNEVVVFDRPAHGACTLTRKDIYEAVGGHSEDIECQDGVDIWLSITEKYKVSNCSTPLFYYRKHPVSLTKNHDKIISNRVRIYKRHAHKRYGEIRGAGIIAIKSHSVTFAGKTTEVALTKFGGKTLLEIAIEKLLSSDTVEKVYLYSDSQSVMEYCNSISQCQGGRVEKLERGEGNFSELPLDEMLAELGRFEVFNGYDCIISRSIYFPFTDSRYIDLAAYNSFIHGFNIVESVVENSDTIYRHDGKGLTRVSDNAVRHERQLLYVRKGGVTCYKLCKSDIFAPPHKGHVVVDELASFELRSSLDYELADIMLKETVTNEKA